MIVIARAYLQVNPGEPLFLSYGRHDCRNLLLSYGFITPNNPLDTFQFDFDADSMMVRPRNKGKGLCHPCVQLFIAG